MICTFSDLYISKLLNLFILKMYAHTMSTCYGNDVIRSLNTKFNTMAKIAYRNPVLWPTAQQIASRDHPQVNPKSNAHVSLSMHAFSYIKMCINMTALQKMLSVFEYYLKELITQVRVICVPINTMQSTIFITVCLLASARSMAIVGKNPIPSH